MEFVSYVINGKYSTRILKNVSKYVHKLKYMILFLDHADNHVVYKMKYFPIKQETVYADFHITDKTEYVKFVHRNKFMFQIYKNVF